MGVGGTDVGDGVGVGTGAFVGVGVGFLIGVGVGCWPVVGASVGVVAGVVPHVGVPVACTATDLFVLAYEFLIVRSEPDEMTSNTSTSTPDTRRWGVI